MARFAWICLGGAAGTGARYLLSLWALKALGPAFPFGTLLCNVLGCLAMGALMHVGLSTAWMSGTTRLALTTGLLGGFTTYSTFNYEALRCVQDRTPVLAVAYLAATVVGCAVAGLAGLTLARLWVGP